MARKCPAPQGRIGHRLHAMLALPWNERCLDGARIETVMQLITLRTPAEPQRLLFLEPQRQIVEAEVTDPVLANEAPLLQLLERPQRVGKALRAAPMQQVEIEVLAADTLDRGLTGAHRTAARGILGQYLADNAQLRAARASKAGQGFAEN